MAWWIATGCFGEAMVLKLYQTCTADMIPHSPPFLTLFPLSIREKPKKKDRGKARVRPTVDRMKLVEDMSRIATKLCPTDAELLLGPNLRVGTFHTAEDFLEEGGGAGQDALDLGGPTSGKRPGEALRRADNIA